MEYFGGDIDTFGGRQYQIRRSYRGTYEVWCRDTEPYMERGPRKFMGITIRKPIFRERRWNHWCNRPSIDSAKNLIQDAIFNIAEMRYESSVVWKVGS
jgi:hypothetical protein